MTPRCCLCGEFASEQTTIVLEAGEACCECLTDLVANEMERRADAETARRWNAYYSGSPTIEDRDRQDLIDAGRGHLVR